jgi:hypothetical protein
MTRAKDAAALLANPRNTKGHTIRDVAHQLRWVRGARGDGSHA